jgi:hypothetical protein
MMQLTKKIPSRINKIEFNWCKKDWMEMTPKYRAIRNKYRNDEYGFKCKWCGNKINDGEFMSLAQPKKGKNWVLCGLCADILTKEVAIAESPKGTPPDDTAPE